MEEEVRRRARPEVAEYRRLRAWELKEQGWRQRAIARALGVTDGAVSQWFKRGREGGPDALRRRKAPGGVPKLTADQFAQIPALLERGAEAFGFAGQVWTTKRMAVVLQRVFGVRYSPGHVSKLVRHLGWSIQKPHPAGTRRATQRNEATIAQWQTERWPVLKKRLTPKDG
jgi:transposase